MLNEEKIILMTKLAIYEKGEGKKEIPMSRYYRNDYVGVHMLCTFLAVTAGYVLLFALYIARDVEEFLSSLTTMDLKMFIFVAVAVYVFAEQIFLLLTWMIYRQRFKKNREHLNEYNKNLKKLRKLQKKEEDAARRMVEGKEAEGENEPKENPEDTEEEDIYSEESGKDDIFREPKQRGYFRRRKAGNAKDVYGKNDPDDGIDLNEEADSDEDIDLNKQDDSDDSIDLNGYDDLGDSINLNREENPDEDIDLSGYDDPDEGTDLNEEKDIDVGTEPVSQDPDLVLEEALRKLMSDISDDDEEDEDGFTFSS